MYSTVFLPSPPIHQRQSKQNIRSCHVFYFCRYSLHDLIFLCIKLAVSPQPRVLGESISVPGGSQLAVKVEGVIQHGKRPGLFRSVNRVIVSVSSQLQTRPNIQLDVKVFY